MLQKKFILTACAVAWVLSISAQIELKVWGVFPGGPEPLAGAGIYVNGQGQGISNIDGIFIFSELALGDSIHSKFTGFENGGVRYSSGSSVEIFLHPQTIDEVEIVESSEGMRISERSIGLEMEMNQKELRRAACCNLSESFENNPSIDVSFSDAITGTRTIEMLGLSGQYLSTHIELVPFLRGVQIKRGSAYIPGPWLASIQLSKGMGSVSVGHESMTGQLNLELRKPFDTPGNHMNLYFNGGGRLELNYTTAYPVNEVWSSNTSIHASSIPNEVDRNGDGFMDVPKGSLFTFVHRWKASLADGWENQWVLRMVSDEQQGGQLSDAVAFPDTSWHFERKSKGVSLFTKLGRVFPNAPEHSVGLIAEAHYQDLFSPYGFRVLETDQSGLNAQLLWDYSDPLTSWGLKSGIQYARDVYRKRLDMHDFGGLFTGTQDEQNVGLFSELSFQPNERFTSLIGIRLDAHNLFGTRVLPRAHFKYELSEGSILRASSGLGFRSPHPWLEYGELLASSRWFNPGQPMPFFEKRLRAEAAWNSGLSWQKNYVLNYRKGSLVFDYFYTRFSNRLIVDRYRSPDTYWFENLSGLSHSHSFMVQLDQELKRRMSLRAAYKFTWSESTYSEGLSLDPFISVHRGFVAWFYETRDAWGFDLSAQFHGPKRLPVSPQTLSIGNSPLYSLINLQVKKAWKDGRYELFFGSENLLDFKQPEPVLNAASPFDPGFDATIVWAPIMGRVLFVGFNLKF